MKHYVENARVKHDFFIYHFNIPAGGTVTFKYHDWELTERELATIRMDKPVSKRQIGFLEKGKMWMDLFDGRRYEYLPSLPPRPWTFGVLTGTLTAAEDSFYTCLNYRDKRLKGVPDDEPLMTHDTERAWLSDGDTFELEDLPDEQFIYPISGVIKRAGETEALPLRDLHRFEPNSPQTLVCEGAVDLVHISNPHPYVVHNLTEEEIAYAEAARVW